MSAVPISPRFARSAAAGYDHGLMQGLRVLLIGAGGLGGNVLLNLALSGVGTVLVVDPDDFEEHNLPQAPLHPRRPGDMGKASNGAAAGARLATAQPFDVRWVKARIQELGHAAFEAVDVVVCATDTWSSRLYVQRMASSWNLPFLTGGIDTRSWDMGVFPAPGDRPELTPCWGCTISRTHLEDSGVGCTEAAARVVEGGGVPSTQVVASSLAASLAHAAIALAHGHVEEPYTASLDLGRHESRRMEPLLDSRCVAHHQPWPAALQVDVGVTSTVRDLLAAVGCVDPAAGSLWLPRSFQRQALCPLCLGVTQVDRPFWQWWALNRRCRECGGPWPKVPGEIPLPPFYESVAGELVADRPLRSLGLVPGDRLAVMTGAEVARVRLSGDVPWQVPPAALSIEVNPQEETP